MFKGFNYKNVSGLPEALGGRVELLEELIKHKKSELSFKQIHRIATSEYAREFFNIGDEITTEYTDTNGNKLIFPWIVVDFRDVYAEVPDEEVYEPVLCRGMVLQAKYATIEKLQFDPEENLLVDQSEETAAEDGWYYFGKTGAQYVELNLQPEDPIPFGDYDEIHKSMVNDINVLRNGYNRYDTSTIRQWLNSAAEKGEWWNDLDARTPAPDELNTYNGFMHGFSEDFLAILKPVELNVGVTGDYEKSTDIVYDTFFLPSNEEMYGYREQPDETVEGPVFEYWRERSGEKEPVNTLDAGVSWRVITGLKAQSAGQICRMRTSDSNSLHKNWICNQNGSLSATATAKTSYSCAPCCVIC